MSVSFDPYHKWLGIPPEEQPPHDYRLLGLRPFEDDPDVIANAADRQTLLLRTLQAGQHRAECQRLLNEVASARVRLLDRSKKTAYDRQLRPRLVRQILPPAPPQVSPAPDLSSTTTAAPAARPLTEAEFTGASVTPFPKIEIAAPGNARHEVRRARRQTPWTVAAIAGGAVLAIGVAVGGYFAFFGGGAEELAELNVAPAEAAAGETKTPSNVDSPAPLDRESAGGDVELNAGARETASEVVEGTEKPEAGEAQPAPVRPPVEVVSPEEENSADSSSAPAPDEEPAPAPEPAPAVDDSSKPKKLAPPSGEALEKARRQVREIFVQKFTAAQTPEQRVELAKMLFDQAAQVQDDPLGRYGLLIEAAEQAIEAGHYPAAREVVETLFEDWEVDRLTLLHRALASAARSPQAAAMRDDLANVGLMLVEEAIQSQRYDDADTLAGLADDLAARARDPDLRRTTRAALARTQRLRRDWEKVAAARKTLEENPDDAAANFAVGKYLCLEAGDFGQGVAHLAKGSDPTLQSLAQRDADEQQHPANQRAEEKIELADAWYALAESEEELAGFFARAHYWYSLAAPRATGLLKTKAERRRDDLAKHQEVQRLLAAAGAGLSRPDQYAGPVDVEIAPLTTLLGHTDLVRRVAFAPQGNLLATGGNDNTAKIWDLEKQKLLFTLVGHGDNMTALAWTPDGKWLATGSEDKTIRIWEAAKGRFLRAIPAHPGNNGVKDLAFAPNGRILISCGANDPAVKLWDARTGNLTGGVASTSRFINSVAMTDDGRAISAGSSEVGAVVWSADGQVQYTFPFTFTVDFAAPSSDARYLVIGGSSSARVYNLEDGKQLTTLASGPADCAAWSPDGKVLALGDASGSLRLYDVFTWELRQNVNNAATPCVSLSFSADGKVLATGGLDNIVRLWQVTVAPRNAGSSAPGTALANNSSTSLGGLAPAPNPANSPPPANTPPQQVREAAALRPHESRDPLELPVLATAFSPNGKWLATGGVDHTVQVVDVAKGAATRTFIDHRAPVTALAFDPKRDFFASADEQGTIQWARFSNFGGSRSIQHGSPVDRLAFTPTGELLVGGRDGKLGVWNTQSAKQTHEYQGHTDAISGLAVTPDGGGLISTGRDGRLMLWGLADRAAPPRLLRHEPDPIDELALSPAGDRVAMILGGGRRVNVYSLATQKTFTINSDGGTIGAAAFLLNGRTLVLGASNGEMFLFDAETGQLPLAKAYARSAVRRILLSPDGARLASISADGELKLWEVASETKE